MVNNTVTPVTGTTTISIREECAIYHDLEKVLSPYAFPMLIEYSVVSATMVLVIWENSGVGFEVEERDHKTNGVTFSIGESESGFGPEESCFEENVSAKNGSATGLSNANVMNDSSLLSMSRIDSGNNLSSVLSPTFELKANQHFNSYTGFVFGWTVICGTSGITILCLYDLYTGNEEAFVQDVSYGLNTVLSTSCALACFFTFFKLSKLTFEDQEAIDTVRNEKGHDPAEYLSEIKHKMEVQLGIVTLLALISWKFFCIIAALDNHDNWILADSFVSFIFGMGQNLFLAYANKKRTKTKQQLVGKPGRQGLEYLRLVNFALWLNNTFLLKHARAKDVMNTTFGEMEWSVLSNIFQPLAILYYFHSMIGITETIHQVYTSKFVGVVRQSKQRLISASQSGAVDNVAFETS